MNELSVHKFTSQCLKNSMRYYRLSVREGGLHVPQIFRLALVPFVAVKTRVSASSPHNTEYSRFELCNFP